MKFCLQFWVNLALQIWLEYEGGSLEFPQVVEVSGIVEDVGQGKLGENVNETSFSDLDLHYKVVDLGEFYNFVVEVEY